MNIVLHRTFRKQLKKLRKEEKDRCRNRLMLFTENPRHPLLKDHKLEGERLGERAIHIGGDLSAIYEIVEDASSEPYALFTEIGTHHELYGS